MHEYPRPIYCDLLNEIAWSIAEEMARARHRRLKRPPIPRGRTLRPGAGTPCWNQLATRVERLLRRRGAKALLARELGLNRGRMTDFFVKQTAMPDAERLLRLLEWYATQLLEIQRRKPDKREKPTSGATSGTIPAPLPAKVRNTNIR